MPFSERRPRAELADRLATLGGIARVVVVTR